MGAPCSAGWDMSLLIQLLGAATVLLTLMDVFLTVLVVRGGAGFLSTRLNRGVWWLLQKLSRMLPAGKDQVLFYTGPILLVAIATAWTSLLLLGFSLIVWPALGTGIRASSGATATGFTAALYYSAYNLTTLGTGDLVPQSGFYRLLMGFQALVGFSVLTLMITYFMSVYSALLRRNAFALSLHHHSAATGNAVELLTGLTAGGSTGAARQALSSFLGEVSNLCESHDFYPVLHYFRFPQAHYALARIMFLVMDVTSLVCTAVDEEAHPQLVSSSAARGLHVSGHRLLESMTARSPNKKPTEEQEPDAEKLVRWREHYRYARTRLEHQGLETRTEAGEAAYLASRRQWQPFIEVLAAQMAYPWPVVVLSRAGAGDEA